MTTPEERFADHMAHDSDEFTFEIVRTRHQPGRSFSADAMDALVAEVNTFIGARIMARWTRTNEPPTVVRVHVKVDVG